MGLLELSNVGRIYNNDKKDMAKVVALQNINLKIKKEDMIAVVGKSGSGKSTLLHILGCLDTPTSKEGFEYAQNNSETHIINFSLFVYRLFYIFHIQPLCFI